MRARLGEAGERELLRGEEEGRVVAERASDEVARERVQLLELALLRPRLALHVLQEALRKGWGWGWG